VNYEKNKKVSFFYETPCIKTHFSTAVRILGVAGSFHQNNWLSFNSCEERLKEESVIALFTE